MPAIAFSMGQDSDENYLMSEKETSASGKAAGLFLSPLRLSTPLLCSACFQSLQTRRPDAEFSFRAKVVYLTTEK